MRGSILAEPGGESSETWFYGYLMGRQRIAVYDGGWYEWSLDPTKIQWKSASPAKN